MEFEFDAAKSESNARKHGIDFVEAQKLWKERTLEIPSNYTGESRYLVIGQINQIFWSAIITYRHEKVRIISVRRSRKKEIQFWHDHQ